MSLFFFFLGGVHFKNAYELVKTPTNALKFTSFKAWLRQFVLDLKRSFELPHKSRINAVRDAILSIFLKCKSSHKYLRARIRF